MGFFYFIGEAAPPLFTNVVAPSDISVAVKPSNPQMPPFTVNVLQKNSDKLHFIFHIFFNVSILTHSSSRKSALNIKCVLFKCVLVGGQWQAMNINCPIGFIGHVVALPDRAMSPRPAMDWNGSDAPAAFLINKSKY